MTPQLETSRLFLRPLELADAEQAQVLFPHWEIVRYLLAVPWPYPPDGALRFYRDVALPAMERNEEWHWSIRLKEFPSRMIGSIALMNRENNNRGFWLGSEWQGRGLALEFCNAATDFWFEELKKPVMRVEKAVANESSRRISQKQGMRLIATGEREYLAGRLPSDIWEITAEEWFARKRMTRQDIRKY